MATTNKVLPTQQKRRRCSDQNVIATSFARFLVIHRTEPEKSFLHVNPFVTQAALDKIAGPVANCTRLRTGSLLVETTTPEQTAQLLKATLFHGFPVRVEKHRSLNSSKGVVTTAALDGLSEEEIKGYLAPQGVTAVHRVMTRREGKSIPSQTVFLTFEGTTLPPRIKAGYEVIRVRPYVPRPMRCFKCQRFGHTAVSCKSEFAVCAACGEAVHEGECLRQPLCVNCNGGHSATDRKCPKFVDEQAIQELRVKEKLSFAEARKLHRARHPALLNFGSFSSVLKQPVQKRDIGVQTSDASSSACSVTSEAGPSSVAPRSRTSPAKPPLVIPIEPRKFKKNYSRAEFLKDTTSSGALSPPKTKGKKSSPYRRSLSQDSPVRHRMVMSPPPLSLSNRFGALSAVAAGEGDNSPTEPMDQTESPAVLPNRSDKPKPKLQRQKT